MNELRSFHEKYTKARKKSAKIKLVCDTHPPLSALLPPQATCDEAVNSYFSTFEMNLRILHYPSFMDEYRRYWTSVETKKEEFNSFPPQLAAIFAIVQASDDASAPGVGIETNSPSFRARVEDWLHNLTGRSQFTIAALRTRALLIIAQQVEAAPADEIWKATGNLMRSAMVAGFHRDPSEFPNIPIFEGELRRRLWMTVMELDFASSLTYGMPVMARDEDFTCKPPSNLDDLDLFDGMLELPSSKPSGILTDSTLQLALAESLLKTYKHAFLPLKRIYCSSHRR
jgi:hypothetical protein